MTALDRDLSWIEFNARVLGRAQRRGLPLLERLRFLAIVSSNFDEFFMVRASAFSGPGAPGTGQDGPADAIAERSHDIVRAQYACLMDDVFPSLAREGLEFVRTPGWTAEESRLLEGLFSERVFPVLTPVRLDPGDRPSTENLRINVAFRLRDSGGIERFATVRIPASLDRFVRLTNPGTPGPSRFALLEDVVAVFGRRLYPGFDVLESLVYKLTRDAGFPVDEERDDDFPAAMEEALAERRASKPVRLVISCTGAGAGILPGVLGDTFGLAEREIYILNGPIDLRGFEDLIETGGIVAGENRLRELPWPPVRRPPLPEGTTILDRIRASDLLLHVPYESFEPVVQFLDTAADDPSVLALKMTLYRTSGDSPVVAALERAARAGKQVTVVVELKARFDEERNIGWAERLERAGAIVVYGIAGLKVHAKVAMVIRREQDGSIGRYLHLSTGNYNDTTARLYSDLSVFTADEDLCRDASMFFNAITGYSEQRSFRRLSVAPFDLKERLLFLIRRETERSGPGAPGLVMAKLNALADEDIVAALYAASRAGVRIMLNVRGICTLVPGVPGISENISVVSVLGRYLEHARILYFRNGGRDECYLSSADWLSRNLERRVEIMVPILDDGVRMTVRETLETYFTDTTDSFRLCPDGTWRPNGQAGGTGPVSAQETIYRKLAMRNRADPFPSGSLAVRRPSYTGHRSPGGIRTASQQGGDP